MVKHTKERGQNISIAMKKLYAIHPEKNIFVSNNPMKNPITQKKVSKSLKELYKIHPEKNVVNFRNPMKNKKSREKMIKTRLKQEKDNPMNNVFNFNNPMKNKKSKEKMIKSVKKWYKNHPEFKKKLRKNILKLSLNFPKTDTSIEIMIQNILIKRKIIFIKNKNIENLTKPDIFIEPNICIYADGCYWHKCPKCGFGNGREKDKSITSTLKEKKYMVLRLWEHDIKNNIDKVERDIEHSINLS